MEDHYHYYICNDCKESSGGILHEKGKKLYVESLQYVACPHCGSAGRMRVSICKDSIGAEDEMH